MLPLICAINHGLRLSAALTVAWLIVAMPASAQSTNSTSRLQALVNDAAAQVRLSYRQDPAERQRRHDEVGRAIAAWNKSARTEADNEELAQWLRQAMQTSMPGSREPLPAVPEFQHPAAAIPRAKPVAGAPQNAATELAPTETPPQSQTVSHSDRTERADNQPTANEKNRSSTQSTAETATQPNADAEKASGEKTGDEKTSPMGDTRSSAEQQPVTRPNDNDQGDPFRDDPLPVGK